MSDESDSGSKAIVDQKMKEDDETTATQLHALLTSGGYNILLRTILLCRSTLGWMFRGSAYCQLIRDGNKIKHLAWAKQFVTYKDKDFKDVIFTDECTVQLETHRRFCCRKWGQPPKAKPRYSSPLCMCIHIVYAIKNVLKIHVLTDKFAWMCMKAYCKP